MKSQTKLVFRKIQQTYKTDAIREEFLSCRCSSWQGKWAVAGLLPVWLIALAQMAAAQTNWVRASSNSPIPIPEDAVIGGNDWPEGTPLYICRGGSDEGYAIQPGRFRSDMTGCDIGFGGQEYQVPDFDFLVMSWQWASGGDVPANAVLFGWDTTPPGSLVGPPLYFCRAILPGQSGWQPGKIGYAWDGCYVPFGGQEIHAAVYQVLVELSPAMPLTLITAANGDVPRDAILAGTDIDGAPLYICLAYAHDGLHPGKLRREFGACDISWGGHEEFYSGYQVLAPFWQSQAPAGGLDFPAGYDVDGTTLHVCRAYGFLGDPTWGLYPGKYRPDFGTCNFGKYGQERWGTPFDVLSNLAPPR
jgi:hypothetical protein